MKRFFFLGLILASLAVAPGRAGERLQEGDELVLKARHFVSALGKGDFESAVRDFDGTMLELSGPPKLAEFWERLPLSVGAFRSQGPARRDKLGSYDIVLVTCEFEKTLLDFRVVFDKEARITGFQLVPSLPPAVYTPPDYADRAAFEEKDITVGTGDWELPGTLAIPRGPGPYPALVLVHGSGPNDRDETLGPNKPFKDLAWGLASRGIAVLRYDKRTKVYGARLASDPALMASFTVAEEAVDDALAAVALLQGSDKIDGSGIFVLGHSLGGGLVPRIARAGRDLGIRGFVILAGSTSPLEETILRQMKYLLGLDGSLSEEDQRQLKDLEDTAARIKALGEADVGSGAQYLNAGVRYWLDLRGYDPPMAAKSVDRPLLVLQGGRDYQVTTDDLARWREALDGRTDVEFHLYPLLNHLFFAGRGMVTPNEYLQRHGSVSAEVIRDIEEWIKRIAGSK